MTKLGISRRRFCAGTGCGVVALGLSGCATDPRVTVGGNDQPPPALPDGGLPATSDLAGATGSVDLSQAPADLATSTGGCGGKLNAGAASAIPLNGAKHFTDNVNYELFVCRDGGGLFSVDALCTHAGCVVRLSAGHWYCPCHQATFNFDGTGPTSPAPSPLNNYSLCVDASGNVWVDYTVTVSPTARV